MYVKRKKFFAKKLWQNLASKFVKVKYVVIEMARLNEIFDTGLHNSKLVRPQQLHEICGESNEHCQR